MPQCLQGKNTAKRPLEGLVWPLEGSRKPGVWGGGQADGWKAKGEGWLPGLVADGRASFGQSLPQRPKQRREGTTTQHRHTQHKNTHNNVK